MPDDSTPLDERAPETPVKRRHRPRSRRRQLIEWVIVIVAAAMTAVVLRAEVVQAFEIPSLSMSPTLKQGDRVLVNKLGHDFDRGDIVVFERPPGQEASEIKDLIKRVIALPGETVSSADGRVLINGEPLDEPYLAANVRTVIDEEDVTRVPTGQYWVMGDNRTQSTDSRFFGPIRKSSIIGRAFVRMWPVNRWGGL